MARCKQYATKPSPAGSAAASTQTPKRSLRASPGKSATQTTFKRKLAEYAAKRAAKSPSPPPSTADDDSSKYQSILAALATTTRHAADLARENSDLRRQNASLLKKNRSLKDHSSFVRSLHNTMKKTTAELEATNVRLHQELQTASASNNADLLEKLEEIYQCPITLTVPNPQNLCKTSDGITYDRDAITRWLDTHAESPMTREVVGAVNVPVDRTFKQAVDLINEYKAKAQAAPSASAPAPEPKFTGEGFGGLGNFFSTEGLQRTNGTDVTEGWD